MLSTKGNIDIIDITSLISERLREVNLKEGFVNIFIGGSTAGITTIEYEDGLIDDLKEALIRLFPTDKEYKHNLKWGDGNGFSHIMSSFIKTSLTVPFLNSAFLLGPWQQVIFIDFDVRPRKRKIILQFVGN